MQFNDFALDARLQRALETMNFSAPTPIQATAIPVGLSGRDLIGTANTGTGKTVAFVLPVLQRLLTQPARGRRARALILTPTRELAEQIQQTIRQLAQFTTLRSATIYGGVGMAPQERALRDGVEILVACPGRLLDHLQQGNANLSQIEVLVLDEADRMLDMGFLPSVKRILAVIPRERHTMLFSATFGAELEQMAAQNLISPARVDAGFGAPAQTVAHALYPVAQHLKTALLLELLRQTDSESVLIFTRTKHRADRLVKQLYRAGKPAGVLHAGRSQNQRQAALDGFRSGQFKLLVATDIAARGIDVASISHVVNYDIPDTADTYIHRIGRTGRAEREGDALTLVTADDRATIRDIERALKGVIERRTVPGFDYNQAPPPAAPREPSDMRGSHGGQRRGDGSVRSSENRGSNGGQRRGEGGRSSDGRGANDARRGDVQGRSYEVRGNGPRADGQGRSDVRRGDGERAPRRDGEARRSDRRPDGNFAPRTSLWTSQDSSSN